ncbi:hypothetical protein XK22_08520 [Streptococcus suis]|nr:hypothetical protein XK22_08520 [Streptococcus suis]
MNQSRKLFSCFRSDFVDQIEQLLQGDGPVQCANFVAQHIKQTAERASIRTLPMLPGQQNIAGEYNRRMADQ